MKFELIVEGDTEYFGLEDFFRKWLNPRLSKLVAFRFTNMKGNTIQDLVKKAQTKLNEPANEDTIAVIGLLDLYGLPSEIYGGNNKMRQETAKERYDWCKQKIEKQVDNARFRQFFAVHEIEAWLLSNPNNPKFPQQVRNFLNKHPKIRTPEEINFDKHPAKILTEEFRKATGREYSKVRLGRQLSSNLTHKKLTKNVLILKRCLIICYS